jgi:hypothetical protein
LNRAIKILLGVGLVAGLVVWLWKDDTARIKQRLKRIETLASHRKTDALLSRQLSASDLREFFSPEVSLTIRIPDHGEHVMSGRAEIMEAVAQVKAGVDQLILKFLDPKVTVPPNSSDASMTTTLHVLLGSTPPPQEFFLEMKLTWQKTKEGWVVSRLETIKTFGR